MASYQDLLDAIARVREATGDPHAWRNGLSGGDIAVASNPISPPGAIGEVLAKVVGGHPALFGHAGSPGSNEGAAADAIGVAETALSQQHSTAAQVDLQMVSAVLKAHTAHGDGAAELRRLQREVEAAVLSRADLDTPAGAREFQRFLIGKVRDIRAVVQAADLDAGSKAALAEALAALYISSTPEVASAVPPPQRAVQPDPASPAAVSDAAKPLPPLGIGEPPQIDDNLADEVALPVGAPQPVPATAAAPRVAPTPESPWGTAMSPAMSSAVPPAMPAGMASAMPAGMPFGGGFPPLPSSGLGEFGSGAYAGEWRRSRLPDRIEHALDNPPDQTAEPAKDPEPQAEAADSALTVRLPDGDSVTAPSPELAAAVTAAVAGTPIPEAFRQQGMTLPPPGSPVSAPLDSARLMTGDIGVYADRLALALGHGKALVDQQIQPIDTVTGPDFLGWLQPPVPQPMTTPEVPAPNRPAQTAPS